MCEEDAAVERFEQMLGDEAEQGSVECESLRDMPLGRVLYHLLMGELKGGAGQKERQVSPPEFGTAQPQQMALLGQGLASAT